MRPERILLVILVAIFIVSCTTTQSSEQGKWTYREDLSKPSTSKGQPFATIFLGSAEGNRILTTNSSRFRNFRIYKRIDGQFKLINPVRKDTTQSFYADVYIWVDEGFTSYAEYRIVAIDKEGKEYEFPTLVATPNVKDK
jgi:hypothetical protein